MLNGLFFASVILYFLATLLQFAGHVFKKERIRKAALAVLVVSACIQVVYTIARGVIAGRIPLANQFEFANAFALGVAVFGILLVLRGREEMAWIATLAAPCAFLLISYAALQPQEITELMPALRSGWFAFHIGSAVLSYAAFALSACMGIRYLVVRAKADEKHLRQVDNLSYRLVSFGFLMLTVTLLTGCVWAEQAWSTFWSWDPKEVWALITWIVYAVYLHQRIRMNWRGEKMAWFSIFAFVFVMFTFAGVNKLMSGLHSYA